MTENWKQWKIGLNSTVCKDCDRVMFYGGVLAVFYVSLYCRIRLAILAELDGDEEAWRRRLLLVKFDNPPVEKKIADFAGILVRDEGKGILNWLINGAKKALADIADGKSIKLPEKLQNDADRFMDTLCGARGDYP